jgi:type II secretory ATPase GspE/PulE/Tfp pilus assembly ATPase PilB-like protein
MPQCRKCGKKGIFLKIEADTRLCLSCKEEYNSRSRVLTEKITAAKNEVSLTKDPTRVMDLCKTVEDHGYELVTLQLDYLLQPSQELLDLIEAYQKIKEMAERGQESKKGR